MSIIVSEDRSPMSPARRRTGGDADAASRTPARSKDAASRRHLAATCLAAAIVVAAPLPYGSVESIWVIGWMVPLALALPFFSTRRLRAAHMVILGTVILAAALVAVLVVAQTIPDLAGVTPHPAWTRAEQLLGPPIAKTVSTDPQQTLAALGRPLLLLLVFLCAFMAATERAGATLLLRFAAYGGLAYAAYGIVALLLDPGTLLGIERTAYVGDLTATFVNRNTAGTFFGMMLILWSVRLLSEIDKKVPRSALGVRDFAGAVLDAPPRSLVIAALAAGTCFVALLLTRSRAGILLTLGAVFVTALLVLRHRMSGRAGLLAAAGAAILAGAVVLELFGGAVAGRIGTQGLVDQGRLYAYSASLEIIREHPWLGTGLGSFRDVFPAYRSPDISTIGIWDRAHSTPIEIAVELGVPAACLVAILFLAGLGRLLYGALTRRRDADVAGAAFGVGLLGCMHALVDFSPQVPGFAMLWLAILGCGLAQTVKSEAADGTRAPPRGLVMVSDPARGAAA